MKIRFWGVRGSIPCPGPHTSKYGGNTPCLELQFGDTQRSVIIDAGTGIRALGNQISDQKRPGAPLRVELFLTHTHWDHIQGFPFFAPIYLPETELKIYGPAIPGGKTLETVLKGQQHFRYFPIRLSELACKIEYIELQEGRFELGGDVTVSTKLLNHTLFCFGYRFEFGGKVICTAYDTEPYHLPKYKNNGIVSDEIPQKRNRTASRDDSRRLKEFFADADVLVHDTQYTLEEYESSKIGWGHSPVEHAIAEGKEAGVKRLALFHHEPLRTDAQIDELTKKYCTPDINGDTDVFFAREGMLLEV